MGKPGPKKGMLRKEQPRSEFAQNLIAIRRRKGVTQIELGKRTGLSQRMISFYETESDGPSTAILKKFALALGVDPKELMGLKKQATSEVLPMKALQKRWAVVAGLPEEDQKYVAKTIDMLAERRRAQK